MAQYLIQTPLAKEQQITHIDPQAVEVEAVIFEAPQLLRWLSSFGPDIEVRAPDALKAIMAERHRLAVEQYIN